MSFSNKNVLSCVLFCPRMVFSFSQCFPLRWLRQSCFRFVCFQMGGGSSKNKKLSKEDFDFLLNNTNFTKRQIKQWYKGFMVSCVFRSAHSQELESYIFHSVRDSLTSRTVEFANTKAACVVH